ncbi:hypothetical protein S40288_09942 [Stachybotrys chartarum IBT 40288]|nr:hypothetical protein S40288_09942 [Stachybotrys chartarum IBT 40288]
MARVRVFPSTSVPFRVDSVHTVAHATNPIVSLRSCTDYHVAWICPVADVELLPARLMLDEQHTPPPYDTHYDENTYTCGTVNGHAVVVATCPPGQAGNVNAGRLTGPMFKTFPNIRMAVLVGIGGGIPRPDVPKDPLDDIHLGDVVVGCTSDGKPACVYHDRGRSKVDGQFEMVGTMQDPDWRLTNALSMLASDHEMGKTTFADQLRRLRKDKKFAQKFARPSLEHDRLFKATHHHIGEYGSNCVACDHKELVQRPQRSAGDEHELVFHRGRIATGNAVVQDGELRDEIGARCDGALCVEMEAAGVDANRRCLVIRGISDYADSHKDDVWRSYAAGNAAAFARELLCRIQPAVVRDMKRGTEGAAPWTVPFVRPPSFVGRETQLAQLDADVSSEGCRRLAICGLGGCGKTALALELAYRTREQQPARATFWVPAVTRESFEQAYREIGTLLRIPGIADDQADVKQLVKARLSDESFGQWLIIVDNADDTSVLLDPLDEESDANRLIDYLPHSRKGSIVFTTRTRKAAIALAGSKVIELGKLNVREAKEVLGKRLLQKGLLEDDEIVHQFLETLTFLPLAIIQAVAFINENGISLSEYILIFRNSEEEATELLTEDFNDPGRYRDTKNPVATTWHISFNQIQEQDKLAAEYLSFMACTTGESIPASLLLPGGSRLERTKATGTLKAYAFITERQSQEERRDQVQEHLEAFNVHALVHRATRNWLREHNQWDIWTEKALARLVEVLPFGGHDEREIWTAYLPHATYVVDVPEVRDTEARMSLLDRIGHCEQTLGQYKAVERACQQLLERQGKVLGEEHPSTLISMGNLALAYSNQGRWKEAEELEVQVMETFKRVLGEEHPDTLMGMANLASIYQNQGRWKEAEELFVQVVETFKRVLGEEHPSTLTTMGNLASTYRSQGRWKEAEELEVQVVETRKRVLGEEHPDTLTTMGNLASTYSSQGRWKEAEELFVQVVETRKRVLGEEHPNTLTTMGSLASTYSHQGRWKEAEELFVQVVETRKRVLGEEHPSTLTTMGNLASTYRSQGRWKEAEELNMQVMETRKRVLGEEHPDTLISMANLAFTFRAQSRNTDAILLMETCVQLRKHVLGFQHPDTTSTLLALNRWQLENVDIST